MGYPSEIPRLFQRQVSRKNRITKGCAHMLHSLFLHRKQNTAKLFSFAVHFVFSRRCSLPADYPEAEQADLLPQAVQADP